MPWVTNNAKVNLKVIYIKFNNILVLRNCMCSYGSTVTIFMRSNFVKMCFVNNF